MASRLRLSNGVGLMALGLLAASPAHALPSDPDLSARDRLVLAHGDLVVHLRDTRESTLKDVLCAGVVHAPAERVWSVLVDYDHYSRIFPRVLKSEVRARASDHEDHYALLHYPWPFRDRWVLNRITFASDHRSISWHRLDGSVKEVVGSWRLIPDGNETLVVYEVRLDPGIPLIPRWAINWGSEHVAPDIIRAVRHEAEAP